MEPQNPPSKIARLADLAHPGTGPTSCDNGLKMKRNGSIGGEGSLPTGLGIGLELGCEPGRRIGCPKSSGFTFLQLRELERQSLIYIYIEAGLPIPYNLVLPIWQSVANSLSGLHGSGYQPYPSFMGWSRLYYDYRNSMEPEPGRCRRTDGKKWRCGNDAVPDQKYCEKHMHRGRQRSKKHVEA